MNTDKNIARMVGILFLVSMAVSLIYTNFFSALLDAPIASIYSNRTQVVVGALFELTNCIAVIGIAVTLFAVLKRQNESLALCYVGFRAIECAVLIVGVISGLLLITLSKECIKAGVPDASYFQATGALILAGKNMALQMGILISGLGGLILTSLLYQSKLIPRVISGWGLIGYVLVVASAVLDIFDVIDTIHGVGMLMYVPGGLFETLIFPIWLIVKGFKSSANVSGAA